MENGKDITPYGMTSMDFGNIKPGKTTELKPGLDYDIEGYGRMFGTHLGSDEGRFVYARMSGDFDISVRVADITNDDRNSAEAGIMIRKDLTADGLMAGMSVVGNDYGGEADQYMLMYRTQRFGSLEPSQYRQIRGYWGEGTLGNDSFGYTPYQYLTENLSRPRPFPNVWVRINKTGLRYTGYLKENDGEWIKVGDICLDMGDDLYAGMFVIANEHSSYHKNPINPETKAVCMFRDLQMREVKP